MFLEEPEAPYFFLCSVSADAATLGTCAPGLLMTDSRSSRAARFVHSLGPGKTNRPSTGHQESGYGACGRATRAATGRNGPRLPLKPLPDDM